MNSETGGKAFTDAWIVAAFDDLKDSNDAEMIICFMTERIEEDNQQCSSKSYK